MSTGTIWPVYGQPAVLRAIGLVLPLTQPTRAASAIGSKGLKIFVNPVCKLFTFSIHVGLGLGDEPVYIGFITAIAWLLVVYLASIAFFRTE